MDELLKKLLEAEILSEETRSQLEEAFATQIDEAVKAAQDEAREQVRIELTEQWVSERETLIEAIDSKVNDYLAEELNELKEDINRFRDLEVEYAEKLVEAEKEMASQLEQDLDELVEKLDKFLEVRIVSEMEELKEDIEEAKKLQFGKEIFEAFVNEFKHNFIDEEGLQSELKETQSQLANTVQRLKEAEMSLETKIRSEKIDSLLKPLKGHQRDVMEAILKNMPTNDLESGYKTFIGRVLKEEVDSSESAEKENEQVLSEDTQQAQSSAEEDGVVVTGNLEESVEEKQANQSQLNEEFKKRLRRAGGLDSK